MFHTYNAIVSIAFREVRHCTQKRIRFLGTLLLSLLFVGVLGSCLGILLSARVLHFLDVFVVTLFLLTVLGLTSLVEDRESAFGQELAIAPIPRAAILLGKILGETVIVLLCGLGLLVLGILAFGVPIEPLLWLKILCVGLATCLLAGAFSVFLLAFVSSQRAAQQLSILLLLPQLFLSGILLPVRVLPWYLAILSRLSPLRYAIDLIHSSLYPEQAGVIQSLLQSPLWNLLVIAAMFVIFLFIGAGAYSRQRA